MELNTGEEIAEKINSKYRKLNYLISWDTNLNSFALKLRNWYLTERNSKQSKANIFLRFWRELNKWNIYEYSTLRNSKKCNTDTLPVKSLSSLLNIQKTKKKHNFRRIIIIDSFNLKKNNTFINEKSQF